MADIKFDGDDQEDYCHNSAKTLKFFPYNIYYKDNRKNSDAIHDDKVKSGRGDYCKNLILKISSLIRKFSEKKMECQTIEMKERRFKTNRMKIIDEISEKLIKPINKFLKILLILFPLYKGIC